MTNNLLCSKLLRESLSEQLKTSKSALLLSAYLSLAGAEFILKYREENSSFTELYMRGEALDFLLGSSSLDAVKILINSGVSLYFKQDLHAKISIFDKGIAFIGSANLTRNGLHYPSHSGNFELSTKIILPQDEVIRLKNDLTGSLLITPEDLEQLYTLLDKMHLELPTPAVLKRQKSVWETALQNISKRREYIRTAITHLTLSDLPHCNPYKLHLADHKAIIHDSHFFGLGLSPELQKQRFESSKIFHFIIHLLQQKENSVIFFGEVTEAIQNALNNKIQRNVLKAYIQNLYAYLDLIDTHTLGVDRPNYSQRIFLKSVPI